MSGLITTLHLGRDTLQAQQIALEVTRNNIANVNTPGYSRQRARIQERDPQRIGQLVLGRGATVAQVQAFRDRFIEIRLTQEQQRLGYLGAQNAGLRQLEAVFNEAAGNGIQDALTGFFGSFLQLASDPASTTIRQDVLAKAGRLAITINGRSAALTNLQNQTNLQVSSTVVQINRLAEQISSYNEAIVPAEAGGVDSGRIRDQRQLALQKLAELIDLSYYENETGTVVVSSSSGRALVTAGQPKVLETGLGGNGMFSVLTDGFDITSEITGGRLGAQLYLRDTVFPQVHAGLDALTEDLVARVNAVHTAGFDLNQPAQPGGNLFRLDPASAPGTHSAARLQLAITDPRSIAAGRSTDPGDNANAKAMFALSAGLSGTLANLNYGEFTSSLVSYIANQTANSEEGLRAGEALLLQLQRQRESVSGVSLDEEAVEMIRYQRAFEASSRFLAVINDLTADLIRMLG